MQRNITFGAIAVLLLGLPGLAAGLDPGGSHAAVGLMDAPARQILATLPAAPDKNITGALDEAAYFTALTLMGENLVAPTAQQAWEGAQANPNPQFGFYQNLTAQWQSNRRMLERVAGQLGNQTQGTVTAQNAERLLLAAHLLVQAESQHSLAYGYLLGQTEKPTMDYDFQRFTLQRPLVQVRVFGQAAEALLRQPAGSGGGEIDVMHLETNINLNGGVDNKWLIPEGGLLHRLARHVYRYETSLGNATLEDVLMDGKRVDDLYATLRPKGYTGALLAIPQEDAQWWLGRPDNRTTLVWKLNLNTVHASLKGSEYEAHLLASSTAEQGWPTWTWMAGLGGVGAIVVGGLAWKHRAASAPADVVSRRKAAVALLLLLAAVAAPAVSGEPMPADPLQKGVAFTEAHSTSGFGNFALADGKVHFVWTECVGKVSNPCYQVFYRNYDPVSKEWSDSTVVHAGSQGSFDPRIFATGDGLQLLWTEGANITTGQPITVWWCHMIGTQCMETQALSDPQVQAVNVAAVVGQDGRLRVVWQEESPNLSAVKFREQQQSSGWGPTVPFSTGSTMQRNPAVAVGANGRAFVAWVEKPKDGNWGVYRMLKSAAVDAGASKAKAIQDLSHAAVIASSRAALAVLPNGTVAAAYTAPDSFDDVYVRELPLGSGNWTQAVNVSRDGGRGPHMEPSIQVTPTGLMVSWLSVIKGTFKVSKAEATGGYWLRPQPLVTAPAGQRIFFPKTYEEADGTIHLVWTGTSTGVSVDQMHYRVLPPPPKDLPPAPTIGQLSPAEEGWSNLRRVPLSAFILSDSPVDSGRSTLTVDGSPVPIAISSGGSVSGEAALAEGSHKAALTIRDQAGNTVTKEWTFGVDRTTPRLSYSVTGPDGGNVTGWVRSALHLRAPAQQDGGAPVRTQVSFGDDGNWKDLTDEGARKMGLRMDGQGLALPRGYLLQARVRALDDAGNVAVGRLMSVGWDDRTQRVEAVAPAWSTSALAVSLHLPAIAISGAVGPGPSIHATATATPKGGSASPQSATATLVPGLEHNGTLSFSGLATGSYTVSIQSTDDAGNVVEFTPATFDVEVDAALPSVEYAAGALSARDAGSGVASITLTSGTTVVQEVDGAGAGSFKATVEWPAGTSVLGLHIRDRAGNTLERVLDRQAGVLTIQVSGESPAVASSPRGIPALPGLAVVVLLVALASLRRR